MQSCPHVDLQNCGMRIVVEQCRVPNISAHHRVCRMSGLGFEFPRRYSRSCSAGDKSRTQRVAGVSNRIQSGCSGATLYDRGNGIGERRSDATCPPFLFAVEVVDHGWGLPEMYLYDIKSREYELADKAATAEFLRVALGRS